MRALTLHQPWASLVALGVKRIETRSWSTKYRGQIAIHSALSKPWREADDGGHRAMKMGRVIDRPLWEAMRDRIEYPYLWASTRPLGAIVATANLVDCVPMRDMGGSRDAIVSMTAHLWINDQRRELLTWNPEMVTTWRDVSDQLPFGDFAPGRWAWLLDDIAPTTERCPDCWGARTREDPPGVAWKGTLVCLTCKGRGSTEPIPAKGRQGLWSWVGPDLP